MKLTLLLLTTALGLTALGPVSAQRLLDARPGVGDDARIEKKEGVTVPLDMGFIDDRGRKVKLGDYIDGKIPVILTLNYSDCPQLCGVMLNNMIDALKSNGMLPGSDFRILTISIDPDESWGRAQIKKKTYLDRLGKRSAGAGWHFLVSPDNEVKNLAESVGFFYALDKESGEYAHPSALLLLTPDGRVGRYLNSPLANHKDLRLSLVEVSDGKIGSISEQLFLVCYLWDPDAGNYSRDSMTIMRIGGILTMLALGGAMLVWWRFERRRHRETIGVAS